MGKSPSMPVRAEHITLVREATDAVAVVGERVALERVGSRMVGVCPFCSRQPPSFILHIANRLYHCFACNAHGDVIGFVQEVHHLDFEAAVQYLADLAGLKLDS
jgi:DNA primase